MNNDYLSIAKAITSNKFLIKKYNEKPDSFSFKYIILEPFLKLHYKIFNYLYPKSPWTSPGSILFFNKVLNKNMVGLEYGSGFSTIYFAGKLKKLISIEHNSEWYRKVKRNLEENKINNVDYFLFQKKDYPENREDLDIYLNEHDEFELKESFRKYYEKVKEYHNNYFDFILIDGRARVRCGLNSIPKLKERGIFILDNSERKRYDPLLKVLESWPKVNTTNGRTNTTIWIKP